jgi:hypothetical protein
MTYKLPDRYELIISDYCNLKSSSGRFQIKDLKRNVTSRKFYEKSLSKLDKIISDYENNLNLLQGIDNLNNNPDVDVILKPGSSYQLFYKGKNLGSFKTLVEIIKIISKIDDFESKIISLNDGEEVSL